jgi:hypothetical protein
MSWICAVVAYSVTKRDCVYGSGSADVPGA